MRRAALLLIALASTCPAFAGETGGAAAPAVRGTVRDGVRTLRDVEYARVGDHSLRLDLYLPETAKEPVPVVIWVHGGAWIQGSKTFCPLVKAVSRGYAVASVGYRLATVAPFPAQIDDVRAAVRFLRSKAKDHGIDPARVGAVGASAGGHLVSLLGTADEPKGDGPSSRVQAVVDYFGPSDLLDFSGPVSDHVLEKLFGGPLAENREKALAASPVRHASKDDPPFLILHGDLDFVVPIRQSERLAKALRDAGVDTTFQVVRGAGHNARGFSTPELETLVASFLDRHLKPKAVEKAVPAPADPAR